MLQLFDNKYPYTDFHELNLDWIISKMIQLDHKLTNFVSLNTIKYADPIEWNIASQYGTNTVVIDPATGIAYISTQPVPAGVSISDPAYWTEIFNLQQIIGNITDNLTLHNNVQSPTLLFSVSTGDWILWNNKLYVATADMIAGTALIEGSNIDAASVEALTKYYTDSVRTDLVAIIGSLSDLQTSDTSSIVNAINSVLSVTAATIGDLNDLTSSDKTSIVNAINSVITDLSGMIGDLNDLNTTDKTSLVNAINEVLDTAGKIVYNPSDAFGLDSTGVTDCADILEGINDNVGFKAGTYLISRGCTINCNMQFPEGAKLNIASGVVVTIEGYIDAGVYEIFTGDGYVMIRGNDFSYPEWFGAKHDLTTDDSGAIQKAFNAISAGAVILQAGKYNYYQDSEPTVGYRCENTITIASSQSDVAIKCNHGKAVICSTASVGFDIQGSTDNGNLDFVSNITLENIILFYVGTTVTASAYNTVIGIRVHGGIRNRTYNCELYNYLTCIYSDTIVAHYIEDCTLHTINTAYGCCIYLNDNVINGAIYPNASFHVDGSILHGGANTIAIVGNGSTLSDLFVRNNEMGGHFECVGLTISSDVQPMVSALDIHITDNIMDNVRRGIDIYGGGVSAASCHIAGNWIANNADYAILLRAMNNASIEGNILNGVLSNNAYQICLNSCQHASIVSNSLSEFRCGIQLIGSLYASICSNSLQSAKNLNTTAIQLDATSNRNNVSNNIIYRATGGSMVYAIDVAGTENVVNWNIKQPGISNNIVSGNIVDGAST